MPDITRSEHDDSVLAAAADYIPVYTRPLHPEVPSTTWLKGCFDCEHDKPSMSEGRYTTIFGMVLNEEEGLYPTFQKAFGIVVKFTDKAWGTGPSRLMALDKTPYKQFPQMSTDYDTVGQWLKLTEDPYVRILQVSDQPAQHINARVNPTTLFPEGISSKADLTLITQPRWIEGVYIDPEMPVASRALRMEDLRFANEWTQQSFVKNWTKQEGVELTPVSGLRKRKR
jgi:hypothetical protein